MKSPCICLVFVALIFAMPPLDGSAGHAAAQGAAPAQGPAAAKFEKVFSDWKTILTKLQEMKNDYETAAPAEKAAIKETYDRIVSQGETMQEALITAAQDAYIESPGTDERVAEFMLNVTRWLRGMDDYEAALPMAELLIKHQTEAPDLFEIAGASAAALCEIDLAKKYFQLAAEKNTLSEGGANSDSLLPYYRDAWPKELAIREKEAQDDDLPRVLLKTNRGEIVIELFENEAPNTVANFISLVEKGFYDGLTFHRVLPGFMAQGGCPEGDGRGGPGYAIPCECRQPNYRRHFRGTLSMAHAGVDTGGSQFFLTFVPTKHLDGVHTAFGRVISGIQVLAKIQRFDPTAPNPLKPDRILKAEVQRKRNHAYIPTKTTP